MANEYDYSDLKLHGRFTHDGDYFTLFTELNGVEVPVQVLSVADYREKFTDAKNAAPSQDEQTTQPPAQPAQQNTGGEQSQPQQ